MNYELRTLTFGEMIGRAFNIYMDNLPAFLLIAAIARLPVIAYTLSGYEYKFAQWLMEIGIDQRFLLETLKNSSSTAINMLCTYIQTGIIINIVSRRYLNKPVDFEGTFRETLSFLLPLSGLSILLTLIIAGGYLLFVIPGIVLNLGLTFSSQILVVEKKGVIESLKRSWKLTNGKKIEILGRFFQMGLCVFVPTFLIEVLLIAFARTTGIGDLILITIVTHGISAIVSPIMVGFLVLLYYNLRIETEGFAIEHMAEEFSLVNADIPDKTR
jgi:hypothetical protein